ncbi:MAG: hypothetical protein LQ349_009035 [Xanthoria aureola]|nr:MAG: hypothetical protein LQ349_009035 [Xanthoria aureola]
MPAIPRWLFPQRRKQDVEGAQSSKKPRVRRRALFRTFSMTSKKDRNATGTQSTESTYVGTASNPHSAPTTYPGILEYTTAEGLDEKAPVASNPPATQRPVDRSSFSDYPRLTRNDLKPLPPLPDAAPRLSGSESEEPVPLVILSVRRRLGSGGSQKSREVKERLRSRFST